ncbi:MAG: acyltransferase family protein [Bdellovibrionota bacterium]
MTLAKTNYRADIDGLRALAALSVLLFHFKVPFFEGGYVGVDIFLVISGYLIYGTSLSKVADLAGIANFFRRRIARIFPALILVIVATLLGTRLVIPARKVGDTYEAALAGLGFFANHYFAATTDYFTTATTSPFIHLWSISLEEQFYLIFPFVLLAASRWRLQAMLALLIFSLGASLVYENTSAVYYLLPFRIWEFCLGAAMIHMRPPTSAKFAELSAATGLALIGSGLWLASALWKFDHILPAAGTALVLSSGLISNAVSERIGNSLFAKIGQASYSIYLLHWPLWILFFVRASRAPSPLETVLLIVLTLGLAMVTFRFIERPALRTIRAASMKRTFLFALVALISCAGMALSLDHELKNSLLPRITESPLGKAIAEAKDQKVYDHAYRRRTCQLQDDQTPEELDTATCASKVDGRKTVLLWGDSYAAHLLPGFEASENEVWHFALASAASCPPVFNRKDRRCFEFHRYVVEKILPVLKPDIVILAGDWAKANSASEVELGLAETMKHLGSSKVLVVGQGPRFSMPVAFCESHMARGQSRV